jgi:signal peptidase II
VSLVSVRNEGVAFGALAGGGLLLVAFVALALSALLVVFVRTADRPGVWLATGLVLGGAVGNVIDRIAYGAVTDFVKISRWPAFNVADMAIVVGAVLLVWLTERGSSSVTEEG